MNHETEGLQQVRANGEGVCVAVGTQGRPPSEWESCYTDPIRPSSQEYRQRQSRAVTEMCAKSC